MMIEIKNVTKTFNELKAIDNVSLKIEKGKIIGLLGSNGSGKTTLIKLITGLLTPNEGSVLIDGNKPGVESKTVISYLSENNALDLGMRIIEILNYYQDFFQDFDREKAIKLLNSFEIDLNKKLRNLSKGTKEKVQLVLTISRRANYYILDEPIGGVDPAARDHILDTILTNFNEDASVIISTHLISDIEKILDEVIFISKGKITLQEDAEKLREERNKSIDMIFREDFKC